ncbi:beta-1,3-galactosyltransferase 1-like isoform X2 [Genypterus blacodes]|uniref:beta-1,3-galactosyltransferase 1-like isoform X2 n=1 Tax=Genypterus blacodes TaxID=154954 RepID=UPI003F75DBF8
MLESSASKGEKSMWSRVRRWCPGVLVLFVFIGTLTLKPSSPNLWGYVHYLRTTALSAKYSNDSGNMSPGVLPVLQHFIAPYPHSYHFILDEPDRCQQQKPFLVLMVPVAPQNKEARDAIRSTWGKETTIMGKVVSVYFLLGQGKEGHGTEEQVLQESQEHHDLLQSDFVDSYMNLTIKTMVMFEWLTSRCSNAGFAMKIDSDMFLNVHQLMELLLKAPNQLYITGLVVRGAFALRDPNSKWFMPVEVFPDVQYPPYLLGMGYVFSLDLPKKIIEVSAHVKAVYIEDVYVGLCLRYSGIQPTDPPSGYLFKAALPHYLSNCYWTSVITTILDSPKQLLYSWETYQTQKNGC